MNEYPLQSFIDLVSFDQQTDTFEESVERVTQEITTLEQDQDSLMKSLDLAKKKLHDMRKEVDRAELEMKDLEQKERAEKKRLDQVKNNKEYQSVFKELEAIKLQQHDYEETLLAAWKNFEAIKSEYEAQHMSYQQKNKDLSSTIAQKKEEQKKLQADLDVRDKERQFKKENIPEEWLVKYRIMRSRVPDPVVPVLQEGCSACFYHLPPQDFLGLKRRKMLQCKGCYRFLYVEQPKQLSE